MVEAFEYGTIPQFREPPINRAPRRKAVGQKPPRAAGPQHIEDRLDDLAHRPAPPPTTMSGRRQIRLDQSPLRIGKITSIAKVRAAMLRSGGRGPHRFFQIRCRNPCGIIPEPDRPPSLRCRFETASKMEVGLAEDVEAIISQINERARPKRQKRFKRVYFVDDRPLWYHFGLEQHARAENGAPPHAEHCWHTSCFRFG